MERAPGADLPLKNQEKMAWRLLLAPAHSGSIPAA
jgi:hypothetical protein